MLWFILACSSADKDTGEMGSLTVCEQSEEIVCEDDIISALSLHDDKISEGEVTTSEDGADFVSIVDATAGGRNASTSNPWIYVRFTETGLEKVEIDDETALDSMDWDLALRRYLLRLNGGSSGSSCVGAASFLEASYDELTDVPEGLTYIQDDYFTDDCSLIKDSFDMGPQVVLSPWWSYSSCVQTTMVPHLIQLANGQVVKMVVEAYYERNQDACNESDPTFSSTESISAIFTLRWTFME